MYPRTYLPTRLYDITTQKMRLRLHLLSSGCVMYRLLLNRREGLSSTLTCACSCCASLALSKVVLSLHATRFNSQACLFQWQSLPTVLIAVPHLIRAAYVIHSITTEHHWNTRCLNLKLLWNNCPLRSVECINFNSPTCRHCRLCVVRGSISWYEVTLYWCKPSRRKKDLAVWLHSFLTLALDGGYRERLSGPHIAHNKQNCCAPLRRACS
jgi:hypothetical protein